MIEKDRHYGDFVVSWVYVRSGPGGALTPRGLTSKGETPMPLHDTPSGRVCAYCSDPINPPPYRVRQGLGRFCSTRCASHWQAEQMRKVSPADRFWSHVDKSDVDGCWPWIGAHHAFGYGAFGNFKAFGLRSPSAHRIAWVLTNGPIPDGLFVLHECDHPPCCNPAHLFLGTHQDNMDDMDRKGRRVGLSRPGDLNPHAKLTWDDVREIRRTYRKGVRGCGSKVLAERFGTTHQAILSIIHGESWVEESDPKECTPRIPTTRLNWDLVREIRALVGQFSYRELAERFGVSKSTIKAVANYETWKEGMA